MLIISSSLCESLLSLLESRKSLASSCIRLTMPVFFNCHLFFGVLLGNKVSYSVILWSEDLGFFILSFFSLKFLTISWQSLQFALKEGSVILATALVEA